MSAAVAVFRRVARHRELILGLTRRELFSPFAGSHFGVAWALLHPLLQMLVYLTVFSLIWEMRMAEGLGGLDDYKAFLLSGMLSWMLWASLLPSACGAVLNSASLVKQADFPAEVLPLRTVLVALVPHLVSLAVLGLYILVGHGVQPGAFLLLPLALAIQAVGLLGAAYALGALCVFVRDVKEVVTVFTAMGIFLVPVFYPPDMVAGLPAGVRWVLAVNPFSHYVHLYRDALYWGELRHPFSWVLCSLVSVLLLVVGQRAFTRLRLFFGNFL